MNTTTTFRLAPQLLAQFDLDEAVLLDEALGRYFAANPVASLILCACRDGLSRDHISARIVRQFRVDKVQADADLDHFLVDMVARGFLIPAIGAAA
ncbi:MAG TPA: PqqD family protein [Pseudomonadota bacterium]|nr:PqqD family protein [Xanthomonadales bacterium]HQW80319.1 PqqD family protein [Pseudomonadota bacterium]